jgi:hypothetical protein
LRVWHEANLPLAVTSVRFSVYFYQYSPQSLIQLELNQTLALLFEHDLFGKPVSTFPDHALGGIESLEPALKIGFEILDIF